MTPVSEKPWSAYTKSDYSVEQWHSACLIHLHDGVPTSKGECKLPVRTPQGTLNRNGVHAAAAALAGARGGVNAPPDKKAAAGRALRRLYKELDEELPESLKQSSIDKVADFIEHYGVIGMKWGVRKDRGVRKGKKQSRSSTEAKRAKELMQKAKRHGVTSLTNKELGDLNKRLELERKFNSISPQASVYKKGMSFAQEVLKVGNMGTQAYSIATSPAAKVVAKSLKKKK